MGRRAKKTRTRLNPDDSVVALLRVSTGKQVQGFSLDAQRRAIEQFAESRRLLVSRWATEPGTSVSTSRLSAIPELQAAVEAIESGSACALIFHESSRLARNERLANEIYDRVYEAGAMLVNIAMPDFDYSTSEGRWQFCNEANLNAYLGRKIGDHSRKGKLEQFEKGLSVGHPPFGYTVARQADGVTTDTWKPFVQVPDEAAAVRKAFLDAALGKSGYQIAQEWNALGLVPHSPIGLKIFQPQSLNRMLGNRYYCGFVTHLGEELPGLHEPIVTEQEWQAAQRQRGTIVRRTHEPLLLQHLASCGLCGTKLYPLRPDRSRPQPTRDYSYYREPGRDTGSDCPDGGALWRSYKAEEQVDRLMESLMFDPSWLAYVEAEACKLPAQSHSTRREEIAETLRRVQREYLRQRLPEREYESIRRELEAELESLPLPAREIRASRVRFESFAELWKAASPETRNEAVRIAFEEVRLFMRERRVEVRPAPEFEPLFQLRIGFCATERQPGLTTSSGKSARPGYYTLQELGIAV